MNSIRTYITNSVFESVFIPLGILCSPIHYIESKISAFTDAISSYPSLSEWNETQKTLNLLKIQLQSIESENNRLKSSLFRSCKEASFNVCTIPISGFSITAFSHVFLGAKPKDFIVSTNAPVFANDTIIVGRVVTVGDTTLSIMMITDTRSKIPIENKDRSNRAILSGLGSDRLRLDFVSHVNSPFKIGEIVFTSGMGGVFPAHYPIARIHSIISGVVYAKPLLILDQLSYVSIMEYNPIEDEDLTHN